MEVIAFKILPLILIFLIAYLLKLTKVFKDEDGEVPLKIIYFIAAPALIFVSLQNIALDPQYFYLPFIPIIIILSLYSLAYFVSKPLKLSRHTLGTFLVGVSIINTGFTFPFLFSVYGNEAVVPAAFFDLGGMFVVFSFVYFIACKYGDKGSDINYALKKILISPPLWAITLGLIFNITHISTPAPITAFLHLLGNMVVPVLMIALGFYFNIQNGQTKLLSTVIFIRMGLGLLLGVILSKLFGLTGLAQIIVIIYSAAPVGYNTITFASLENLDTKFAASLLSVSVLIGMILIPTLIYFVH